MAGRCHETFVIVVHPTVTGPEYTRAIVHESLHVLEQCTEYPTPLAGDRHQDPVVWKAPGGEWSVQAQTEQYLLE